MIAAQMEPRLALPAGAAFAAAGLAGAAVALHETAAPAIVGLLALGGLLWLAWRAGLLDAWALLLVALLSANYNVFINANAFIAGGADRGRTITAVATVGLVLFALAQNELRRSRGVPVRLGLIDGLMGALLVVATAAFARGWSLGNPRVYLLGDYGQLVQIVAAYAAVRVFAANAGPAGLRSFLVLLGLAWGLRAAAELLFPEARGTAVIILEGQELFRRTDPLGPLALPLLIGLLFSEQRKDRAILLAGCLALVATQNVLGFTRAHYLAVGAAIGLLALVTLWHPQGRGRLLQAAGLVAVASLLLYATVAPFRAVAGDALHRFEEAFDPTTQSRLHREAEASAVMEGIRGSPLLGFGLGAEYLGADPDTLQPTTAHFIHDDYLALWMRGGVLLAGVWVALLATALWRGLFCQSPLGRLASAAAAAGVFGIALTGVLSGSAFGYVAGPITALLLAVATWPDADALPAATRASAAGQARLAVEHGTYGG